MNSNSGRRVIDDVLHGAISANEFTGALQKISVDPDEVARFHAQFVGDDE